jgi:hypothetical protein
MKSASLRFFTDASRSLALAEARLVTAKLLWHFDMELNGDHSNWVQDARFYVSLWMKCDLKHPTDRISDLMATAAAQSADHANQSMNGEGHVDEA